MRKFLILFGMLSINGCGSGSMTADAGGDLATAADLAALPDLASSPDLKPATIYTVLVRATLKNDVPTSKTLHDMVAKGGEANAKKLGDIAHQAYLAVYPPTDGGTPPQEYLGIDQWTDLAGFMTFAADPNVQAGFGMIFTAPPELLVYESHPDWHSWGKLDNLGETPPIFLFTIRGPLAAANVEDSHKAHDQVAAGGEAQAKMLGDFAHLPHLGVADPKQYMALDKWHSVSNALMLYTDPNFQAAFAPLFSDVPELRPYAATDWYQW